jgi:surface protein
MPTTKQYIDKLKEDKQTLVDNLIEKGVDATSEETFTSLVPKVLDIQTGGGDSDYFDTETVKTSGNINTFIKTIPLIDTSKFTSTASMFQGCSNLTTIPELDTSKVTNMSYMFQNCSKLTTIPQLDTSNVTNMYSMFYSCSKLETVPALDTSNVTNMYQMFYGCSNLTTIPQLDTSNVTSMSYMFQGCSNLTTIPELDTSKVVGMTYMFTSCSNLTTIPELDTSNVANVSVAFSYCSKLTTLGGFKDLGKAYSTSTSANYSSYTLNLSYSNNLTEESLMNVINNLYDIATAGCKTQKLVLGSTNLAKLTSEQIAIATDKGWTVS